MKLDSAIAKQWLSASDSDRIAYAERAVRNAATNGLGTLDAGTAVEGITYVVTNDPSTHTHTLEFVFGLVFAAVTNLGDYRSLCGK